MRVVTGALVAAVLGVSAGCATQSKALAEKERLEARAKAPEKPVALPARAQATAGGRRYVDPAMGFEISRPDADWQLDASDELTPEGLAIPVVLRHRDSGAQVVLQVAPAVATPTQFAEKLTNGLRSHPGIIAGDPEPLPLSDGAVGFQFAMGDKVNGRVAVVDGGQGQVFMMMATWPSGSPEAVSEGVEEIFGSLKPIPHG